VQSQKNATAIYNTDWWLDYIVRKVGIFKPIWP